jgi:maltooligosyltrehalose trehalohydrolase
MKRFVAAAHDAGLAVILDVVYNHFGPDGNYWESYSDEFFVKGDGNIWGKTIDFASKRVRDFFIGNVAHWMEHYHIDGFRLDATHAIVDKSEPHILTEIAEEVRGRGGFTIAEDERNLAKLITAAPEGIGIDAAWADDFHHVLKVALTNERFAHFRSYEGTPQELLETVENGWLFRGQTYPQWKKSRGTECAQLPPEKFVYCISNHDQVGNRPIGERLNHIVSPEAYAAASALLCLLPYTPMLWMGQEWAASATFCFFTDHGGEIGRNVSKGRLKEFQHYGADFGEDVLRRMPDPQDPKTFYNSKLNWTEVDQPQHQRVLELYKRFLEFRRTVLIRRGRGDWKAYVHSKILEIVYDTPGSLTRVICDLYGGGDMKVDESRWRIALASGNSASISNNRLKFETPETVVLRGGMR